MASTSAAAPFAQMPPKTADLDETWTFLTAGVDHIMTKLETGLSFAGYTSLYTTVYNYCTSTKMHGKLEGNRTGANLVGSDLYSKLTDYFANHFKPIVQNASTLRDEPLLRYYAAEWDRYTTGANYLNRLFTYLNRYWVKRERDEGKKAVYQVYTLALAQWHLHLFTPLQPSLTSALLRLIQTQRDGGTIDQTLVKKIIDSYVSLGLDAGDPNKECLDVYKEKFESPFLAATESYYSAEATAFLNGGEGAPAATGEGAVPPAGGESTGGTGNIPEYLKKAEGRLKEEDERVVRYLHAKTRKELVSRCEGVLLRAHAPRMWEAFQALLDFDADADLQRMYALLARIQEGLEPLRRKFEAHVKAAGLAAVEGVAGGAAAPAKKGAAADADAEEAATKGGELDPKAYVDALLAVHEKNAATVARSFKGEAGFAAALDKACREFVNRNAATGTSAAKSPELLAKHADMLLRKSNKMAGEGDLEGALNRVMILFKYLEDKDVFQTFYTTKLSKRLIHGVSASDEAEASMISKLKEACGFEYTNKLQRMFTDMSLSKDLTDSFKERMAQNHDDMDIAFSIMVLGTNFWPLAPPTHDFLLPPELLPTFERFTRYYQTKHSGRKLTWLHNYSKNELRTNYTNQKYILMTSAYQAAVLLQYNRNDTLSLTELQEATKISVEILGQVLALLVKAKVLVNEEKDQYDLNPGFKSKKIRVNLNLPIKAEVKAETGDVLKAVDEDRKYVIQATIVRIMKARKTMKNQALIQEVISQISQRFAPKIPDIKKAIETLLEKEYIERVDGSKDTFAYVA
ncbi:ubiquitin-protein ligase [Mycena metata]|uniref:Cullin-1 n=1 Tax=Mycena metata TaxID=1033252 RepID=A0AAD7IB84_9AGAR|nr:ubiquitin-protein ligase [Mycena metata]